jgi:PadR family transcriptional regulator AphA
MSPLVRQPLTLEHALLGFLYERPMHGYEIHQYLASLAGLGLVWQVKQSHLYAMLDKLEGDGYIAGKQQAQAMRPPRRVFRLTSAGRKAFRDWLSRPVSHGREIRLEFLAKLYFARRVGAGWVSQLIERQRQECGDWRASLLAQSAANAERGAFAWLVYQFRVSQVESMLAWLDLCAEAGPEPGPVSSQDAS